MDKFLQSLFGQLSVNHCLLLRRLVQSYAKMLADTRSGDNWKVILPLFLRRGKNVYRQWHSYVHGGLVRAAQRTQIRVNDLRQIMTKLGKQMSVRVRRTSMRVVTTCVRYVCYIDSEKQLVIHPAAGSLRDSVLSSNAQVNFIIRVDYSLK